MSITTFRYSDVIQDYRKSFNQVIEGYYYKINFKKDGKDHEIIRISIFDSSIDDERKFLKVTSRDFNSNTAFYLNFVRYTFSNLIITSHGKPKWVVEPMHGMVRYMLSQLKLSSRKELKNLLLDGHLINLIGGNPSELRREAKALQKKIKIVEGKRSDAIMENNRLKDKIGIIGRQYKDLQDRYRNTCNPSLN